MAVRTVHIQLNWPVGIDPAYQAARGKVYVGPHDRQLIDTSEILLPKPVTVKLDANGEATIDVLTGIVYKWDEDDVVGGDVRYFAVPEGLGAFEYASGEDLDPETLEPSTVAVGWWTADLEASEALARDASNLTSGIVPDARLSPNIARVTDISDAIADEATSRDAAIAAAFNALLDGAPGALDTLNELAAAVNDDESFAASVTTALAARLVAASNLSDLADVTAARTNLGLGSAAVYDSTDFATPDLGTRLAYAVNETGVPTGYGSTAADLAYLVIDVPPSPDRDVWIEWGTTFYATTVAHGTLKSMLYEVTGADTFREYVASDVSANGLGSADPHSSHRGSYLVGRTTTYRTFIVKLITTKKTGVTYPAGGVFNGYQGINPKSWMGAFAR